MADDDQYEQQITEADEMMAAKWSSSQAEFDAYNAEQAAADDELGREVYKKHQTDNMPVPERYYYKDIDTVEELPLNKFREGAQFFAGVDVATGKKELDSVLDAEVGYVNDTLDRFADFAERFLVGAADKSGISSGVRVGGGAAVNIAQSVQNMGIFLAEMAADTFGPEISSEEGKEFWRERRDQMWMNEMPEAFKAESGLEGVMQEMVAYMAPYLGLSKMAGVFQLARQGKIVQSVAADSIVASIMAQGRNPEEGTIATMARDMGFDNWFLEAMDSRQSYENDEKWISALQRGAEETAMTAVLPIAIGMYSLARRNITKDRAQALKDLVRDFGNGTVTPDGGTRAEPVDKGRRDFLKATAAAAAAPVVGVAGDAATAVAPAAKAAEAAPVVSAAARTAARTTTGYLADVAKGALALVNKGDEMARNLVNWGADPYVDTHTRMYADYRDMDVDELPNKDAVIDAYSKVTEVLGELSEGQNYIAAGQGDDTMFEMLRAGGYSPEEARGLMDGIEPPSVTQGWGKEVARIPGVDGESDTVFTMFEKGDEKIVVEHSSDPAKDSNVITHFVGEG